MPPIPNSARVYWGNTNEIKQRMAEYHVTYKVPKLIDALAVWPILFLRWVWYGYSFRRVRLRPDKYAIVEPRDFEEISKYMWCAKSNRRAYVAVRFVIGNNCGPTVYMHRQLLNPPKDKLVDHINRNPLDNRRANLRPATKSQNNMNRCGRRGTSSKYKGVSWYKAKKCWRAMIQTEKKNIFLGYFESEVEAAMVYDEAARKYHGEFAYQNFGRDKNQKGLKFVLQCTFNKLSKRNVFRLFVSISRAKQSGG